MSELLLLMLLALSAAAAALVPARLRGAMSALAFAALWLVLFVLPAGGGHNPVPLLVAIGLAGFVLGLGVVMVLGVARRHGVRSEANG